VTSVIFVVSILEVLQVLPVETTSFVYDDACVYLRCSLRISSNMERSGKSAIFRFWRHQNPRSSLRAVVSSPDRVWELFRVVPSVFGSIPSFSASWSGKARFGAFISLVSSKICIVIVRFPLFSVPGGS